MTVQTHRPLCQPCVDSQIAFLSDSSKKVHTLHSCPEPLFSEDDLHAICLSKRPECQWRTGGMLGDEGVTRWPMILAHISAMGLSQRIETRKERLNIIDIRQNFGRYAWRCHWVLSQWTGQRFSEPKRKWFEGKGEPSGAGSTSEPSLTPMGRSKSVWCAATNTGSHDLRCKRTLMQTAGWKIKQTEMFRAIKRKASTSYHHANKT